MKTRYALYPGVALMALLFTSCSGIGTAVVTQVDGQPCFAVPRSWDTLTGIPLYGLAVSKTNLPDAAERYSDVWRFTFDPPGSSMITKPGSCLRYGVTPARATKEVLEPLEPFRVYHLFMHARGHNSHLRGYDAEFCVKPVAGGGSVIHVVTYDDKAGRRRYELCDAPLAASNGEGLTAPALAK
jgi:hypothetical protein